MDASMRNTGDVTGRNFALELVRVPWAALATSKWIGLGKKNEADGAVVKPQLPQIRDLADQGDRTWPDFHEDAGLIGARFNFESHTYGHAFSEE
jgi:hypothetical protein